MGNKYMLYLSGDRKKASSRVRGYWIAEELISRRSKCYLEHRNTKLALVMFAMRLPFYDIIIFQKTYGRWHAKLQNWAKFLGKTTILDIDDAPSRTNDPATLRNVIAMMKSASAVTVGSKALKTYAEKYSNRVSLLPSSIHLKYYQPLKKSRVKRTPICIGWIGNGSHYKRDLIKVLQTPLTEVAKRYPIRFKVVGACNEVELYRAFSDIPGISIDFIDQVQWDNPEAVSTTLQDVDIGLYPLLSNDFNMYKCGFKALEYMAMSIPVVSSRLAENQEIIIEGETGFFAENSEAWEKSILHLVRDDSLRELMGENGRKIIEQSYSTQVVTNKLCSMLDNI